VVIGGLTSSTLITLVFIPAVYAAVKDWQGVKLWQRKIADLPGHERVAGK